MSFVCPNNSDVFREFMNGFKDNDLLNYELTYLDSFINYDGLDKITSDLFIYAKSYIMCADAMVERYRQKEINVKLMYDFSIVLPVLYNCRHAVELLVKALCQQINGQFNKNHNLLENWNTLNIQNIELTNFIKLIDFIDTDGMTIRYPYNKNNMSNCDCTKTWTNIRLIVDTTISFYKEISIILGIG